MSVRGEFWAALALSAFLAVLTVSVGGLVGHTATDSERLACALAFESGVRSLPVGSDARWAKWAECVDRKAYGGSTRQRGSI
tara:strand:- start:1148 stop:1393 length:246 start_codon:yes stop_codon:yes gene_type:complete